MVYVEPSAMDSEKHQVQMSDDVKQHSLSAGGDYGEDQKLTRRILFQLDTR